MGNEEKIDGAGVEVEILGPENLQPHVVDAVVVEPAPVAAPANAPDLYAVGVRLIKMSPVWLLTVTGGFAFLILLLSWMRPGAGAADAASIPNDAKSVAVQPQPLPAAKPVEETPAPAAAPSKTSKPSNEERAEVAAETHAAEPVKPEVAKTSSPEPAPAEQQKQPARVVTPASDEGGKFTVQVASFNGVSQANERISSLRAAGFDARSTEVEIPGRGKWHRVHVGRFSTREEAAKVAAQLREKGAAASSMVVAVQ